MIRGRYYSTPPTLTDGQWSDLQLDTAGNLKVTYVPGAGPYSYSRKTADGQVKATAGFVHSITISPTGSVVAGVLTIYDSATETGTILYSVSLPITTFATIVVPLDVPFANGLYIGFDATLANVQVTVSYT